jgi:hypothetical protein
MEGGVRRGYCETGNLRIAITPASESTIAMTIAKRGRSINVLENVFIWSIDFLIDIFIYASFQSFH